MTVKDSPLFFLSITPQGQIVDFIYRCIFLEKTHNILVNLTVIREALDIGLLTRVFKQNI